MAEGLIWVGGLAILGAFVTMFAKAIRTSGLKRVGWFAEFHHEESRRSSNGATVPLDERSESTK